MPHWQRTPFGEFFVILYTTIMTNYFPNSHNKFYNIQKEYNGRVYHSKKEADYACELDLLQRAGEIKWWIPQYKIDLIVNDKKIWSSAATQNLIQQFQHST